MGNILYSSHSEPDNPKILEKVKEAMEKKHLRIPNQNLRRIPRALASADTKNALLHLKSVDIHGNPLQHFPQVHLPDLTSLNLWGNNMTNQSFAPYAPSKKRKSSNKDKRSTISMDKLLDESTPENMEKGAFSRFPKLDSIDIGANKLLSIPASIQKCSKLTQLSASANFLQIDSIDAIKDLTELNILDLDLNELSSIPPLCWEGKPNLFTLSLRSNNIKIIPNGLKELCNVQTLNLANNQIETIEEEALCNMTVLKNIYLFGNQLETLPNNIFAPWQNATKLLLQQNCLSSLPPVDGLVNLRMLDISYNSLKQLPELDHLTSLTQCNISHNHLSVLPDSIGALIQLRSLDASNNRLSSLPASMVSLQHLNRLFLTANLFTSGGVHATCVEKNDEGLQVVWSLAALETLFVGMNDLQTLPLDAFMNLTALKTLNLSHNKLTNEHFPNFVAKKGSNLKVENIFLSCNRFSQFPVTQLLPLQETLQTLCVEGNCFFEVPLEITLFTKLSRLSLSAPYSNSGCDLTTFKVISELPLQRLYVGTYYSGSAADLGFQHNSFPELMCSDISDLDGFPPILSLTRCGVLQHTTYGSALCTGTSHGLEDCVHFRSIQLSGSGSNVLEFISLFDGHGGTEIAEFVQQHLAPVTESYLRQAVEQGLKFMDTDEYSNFAAKSIIRAFVDTDESLREHMKNTDSYEKFVGSTALVVLRTDEMLYCANVGDSRAVLATLRGGRVRGVRLSCDHKPGVEKQRIRNHDGVLVSSLSGSCSYRLTQPYGGPTLAVSRSFGDFHLRPALSVEPDVCCHTIHANDQFIVMASDGLWDVLTDQMCVDVIAKELFYLQKTLNLPLGEACEIAASHVRNLVFSLGSNDDLSVVIIPLSWDADKLPPSHK